MALTHAAGGVENAKSEAMNDGIVLDSNAANGIIYVSGIILIVYLIDR